jgi:hypothetical protein
LFRSTEAPPSTRALEEAVKLAQLTSGRLRLLHVSDVLTFATGFETYALYKADVLPTMKRAGEHVLDDGKAHARSRSARWFSHPRRVARAMSQRPETIGHPELEVARGAEQGAVPARFVDAGVLRQPWIAGAV